MVIINGVFLCTIVTVAIWMLNIIWCSGGCVYMWALLTLIPRSWYPSDKRNLFSRFSPRRLSVTVMEELLDLSVAPIPLVSCCAAFNMTTVTVHQAVRKRKVTPSTICIQRIHCQKKKERWPEVAVYMCEIVYVHVCLCVGALVTATATHIRVGNQQLYTWYRMCGPMVY